MFSKKTLASILALTLISSSFTALRLNANTNTTNNPVISIQNEDVTNTDDTNNVILYTGDNEENPATDTSSSEPASNTDSSDTTTDTSASDTSSDTGTATTPAENSNPDTASTENLYDKTVTFVSHAGSRVVKFHSGDEPLDKIDEDQNTADTEDHRYTVNLFITSIPAKKYFLFFSDTENYLDRRGNVTEGARGFYKDEPIKNVFPDGIPDDAKLYAVYMDDQSVTKLADKLSGGISINRDIDDANTMYEKFALKQSAETEEQEDNLKRNYYIPNDVKDKSSIQLGAEFVLNPFINAHVRWSKGASFKPAAAQYYGNWDDAQTSTSPSVSETAYTFIDLVVELDKRIELSENLTFDFYAFAFEPRMILDKNYQKIEANFVKENNNPNTTISFNSANIVTEESDTHKTFIIRTVIRGRDDNNMQSYPFEESNTKDMRLITKSEDNFTVSKEELIKIAKGESEPIEIKGYIKGGAYLYNLEPHIPASYRGLAKIFFGSLGGPTDIPETRAKANLLNYHFNTVTFNKNETTGEVAENLGASYIVHASNFETSFLKANEVVAPAFGENNKILGNSMFEEFANTEFIPLEDNKKLFYITKDDGLKYYFREFNTEKDGSGTTFTKDTVVENDLTVYAIWSSEYTNNFIDEEGNKIQDPINTITEHVPAQTLTLNGFTYIFKETKVDENNKYNVTHVYTKEKISVDKPGTNSGGSTGGVFTPGSGSTTTIISTPNKPDTTPTPPVTEEVKEETPIENKVPKTFDYNNRSLYLLMLFASLSVLILGRKKIFN